MKKRILAMLMAGIMVLGMFAGCGSSSKSDAPAAPSTPADSSKTETKEDAAPVEEWKYTGFDEASFNLSDYDLPEGIDFTQGDKVTLTAATSAQTGGSCEQTMWLFKAIVEAATEGRITVNAFNGGQLGSGRETFEQCTQGMLDIYWEGCESATTFVPILDILSVPYAFASAEHAYAFLANEELVGEMEEAVRGVGVEPLTFLLHGFHDICCDKPMVNNGFNGQKIRTLEVAAVIAAVNAMGGIATPMAWSEVYTGLQQGTIDGCSTLLNCINLASFYEVQDYTYVTEHMCSIFMPAVSAKTWEKLSDNDKALLVAAAQACDPLTREMYATMTEEHGGHMTAVTNGRHQVFEVENKEALIEAVREEVYPMYEGTDHYDFLMKIVNLDY